MEARWEDYRAVIKVDRKKPFPGQLSFVNVEIHSAHSLCYVFLLRKKRKPMGTTGTDIYLTEECDGLLVQGLGVTNVATDHTLEGKVGTLGEFLIAMKGEQ